MKNGQNDVEVVNLPTCLDEGSIRVDGIGNAVIFDVVYREQFSGRFIDGNLADGKRLDPPSHKERKQNVAEARLVLSFHPVRHRQRVIHALRSSRCSLEA